MNSKHQFSYWEKDTFLKPYDLVIVGAGIVGLSSALFYRSQHPDARIIVLDKGFIPEGASTRNAGFACVGSITEHINDLEKESEQGIKKRIQKRYEGLHLLKNTLGEKEIGYEPCGGFELFTNQSRFEKAADHIPQFNQWLKELVDEENVYKIDTLNGYDVIHNRLEGALHPGKMMMRFIHLVLEKDIEIKWNMMVSGVSPDGAVLLDKGLTLNAKKVLIAANGFVRNLLPELSVSPARGFVFVTNQLSELTWRGTFHYDQGYIYFRDIDNRLLLGGARNIASDEESTMAFGTNKKIKNHLLEFAQTILKLEKGWQIDHEWSGIMGFTESKTPILQKIDDRRYVAAGLSGMGVAIGTSIGKSAAVLLSNK